MKQHSGLHCIGGSQCFKLVNSLNDASDSDCPSLPHSINNLNDLFCNVMFDAMQEIKHAVQPIFRRPYLSVKLQNIVNAMGLYDTGADISCINAKVFGKIRSSQQPRALPVSRREQFRAAGGHHLKVNGQFEVNVNVEGCHLTHNFFVIKNLNEPIIFGIDFIEKHKLNYCASEKVLRWKGESDWGSGHLKV